MKIFLYILDQKEKKTVSESQVRKAKKSEWLITFSGNQLVCLRRTIHLIFQRDGAQIINCLFRKSEIFGGSIRRGKERPRRETLCDGIIYTWGVIRRTLEKCQCISGDGVLPGFSIPGDDRWCGGWGEGRGSEEVMGALIANLLTWTSFWHSLPPCLSRT
jgi:hypothetical protein